MLLHALAAVALEANATRPVRILPAPGCGLDGKRCPALMVFGGFQEAARVLELVKTRASVVLASFDYPFEPPRKFEFPASLRHAPAVKRMVAETVDGIRRLAASLAARPDVDPRRIVVVGASLGAPFAALAAAGEPGIAGVALVEGFGDVPGTAMHQLLRRWGPRYGWFARPAAWLLAHAGWWYVGARAPEDAARELSAAQAVLLITARQDQFVPAASSEALWSAIEESKARRRRVFVEGDHVQPGSDLRGLLTELERWLLDERLLTAEEAGGLVRAYAGNARPRHAPRASGGR
jgi:fermentation-respiration switch protein FrsA (DUF1100 family)